MANVQKVGYTSVQYLNSFQINIDFVYYSYSYNYAVRNPTHCRDLIKKSWRGHLKTILGNAGNTGSGSMPKLLESEKLLVEIFSNRDIPDSLKVYF